MGNRLGVYGQAENGDGKEGETVVSDDSVASPLIEDIPDVDEDTPSATLDNIISMIISKYEAVISSGQLVDGNLATIPELRRRNQQLQGTLAKIIQILKEKQNVSANLAKHNEALQHQVDSLKDVIAITRDLLNIRNTEVDHLHEDMQALQDKITLERKRQGEITEKMENASKLNDTLKAEYQKQMDLFSKLRVKYEERQEALARENALLQKQLDIARNIVNSAQNNASTPVGTQADLPAPPSPHIISPTNNNTSPIITPPNNPTSSVTPNATGSSKPSSTETKSSPKEVSFSDVAKSSTAVPASSPREINLNDEEEEDEGAVSVVLKSVDNVLRLETSSSTESEPTAAEGPEEVNIVDSD